MALLDHFRAQPGQKHPDPAVRLAFVNELPIDQRELLAEVAREDPDPRVRRAAVAKLMDPSALAAVTATDTDPAVRSDASTMLRDLALDAFEGVGEAVAVAAVDAITDQKILTHIAKAALREPIAVRALERITEPHALGSIARHAALEPVRVAALAALADPADIAGVALRGEFRDTVVAAVERLADRPSDLEEIAARAKNKSAAKRARALLKGDGEQPSAEGVGLLPALEVIAIRAVEAPAPEPPVEAQPTAAVGVEASEPQEEPVAAQDPHDAEPAAPAPVDPLKQREIERKLARLTELVTAAETAVVDEELASARRRFDLVRREWKDVSAGVSVDAGVTARYAAARTAIDARERAAEDHAARSRREALTRLQQLLARVEPLPNRPELSLKGGERALRDIRAALADIPPLPSRQEHDAIVHRLKAAQAALVPKVQELREAVDWKRWANVGIQEQLCTKMEALAAVEDPEHVAREVRVLQEQWKQSADVPRAQGEALWKRFKAAHDAAWARCAAHFAAQAAERAANLTKKLGLIARAEAIAGSTTWIATAEEIKRLQAEWKTIGPVSRGQEKAVWERFRAACDRFFTRRQADLVERKKTWTENLAKKEALCVRAEALAESSDWEQTAADIRRLQAEWKTIGPVKKTRSEAIWQRFRTACDRFFLRYADRHAIARADRIAAREALCAELEALASDTASGSDTAEPVEPAATMPEAPADLLNRVRAIRARWHQEIAARAVDREHATALDARFQAAFNRLLTRYPGGFAGTEFDVESNRKRMETLVHRMEELAQSVAGPAGGGGDSSLSPTARLAAMLKEALAANTIGGKVDDSSRRSAAVEDVRRARASWTKIGPVPEDVLKDLSARFERACRRITDRPGGPGAPAGPHHDRPPRRTPQAQPTR